ncbi:MAG: LLM class flavin-dependent oxidoreductase [Chloroflexi bacterium]|nr:LLM class flavin-dependent oxidoreductase [Chloroflexota bacterium]
MKAGLGIDPRLGLSAAQQRDLVQEAARLGYASLWTPAGLTGRSIFQTCREWWAATTEVVASGLSVGTSVIPFPGWTVPPLAAESATLNEITGGKFKLGIGLGSYPAETMRHQLGLPLLSPLAMTRDYLSTLHSLLAGESVDYTGKAVSLHGIGLGIQAPPAPVYLAAMGPQMLSLSGELADGVTPNWSSPEQIARMRPLVAEGARRAGRDPAQVPFAQYIRVCLDEDQDAARRAFASQVLSYALARPGQPKDKGYRGHFGRMGFEEILTELETRRDAGASPAEFVDAVPADLLLRVGYFGHPSGVAAALRSLSRGLDEAMVRIITVRAGDLEACLTTVRACQPVGWVDG